jgi:hypothetical protein
VSTVGSVGSAEALVATRILYPNEAFATELQLNMGEVLTPVVLFPGASNVGAASVLSVLKFRIDPTTAPPCDPVAAIR